LVVAELGPTGTVVGIERGGVLLAIERVVAVIQWQEGEATWPGLAGRLYEVERKRAAIARARSVGAAAIVSAQQQAGVVTLAQRHQAPSLAELDEALRLAGHVDGVGGEPRDQRAGRGAGGGG